MPADTPVHIIAEDRSIERARSSLLATLKRSHAHVVVDEMLRSADALQADLLQAGYQVEIRDLLTWERKAG